MKCNELEKKMRVFETSHDYSVLPGLFMAARLDGRSFTRLTKEVHKFEAPFDERFRDLMLDTAEFLMHEFSALYGYTQSDEISLLFPQSCELFSRRLQKLNSVLSGLASARFSKGLGELACFDCRISELPSIELVVDYFRWRNEDACRNALNGHCYWCLRRDGKNTREATSLLMKLSSSEKNELLFQHGINFNAVPSWQKRGTGIYWEKYDKEGVNRMTGEAITAERRRIRRDMELPMKDSYSEFVRNLVNSCEEVI